jgi:RNA polymerase primary sigma factor
MPKPHKNEVRKNGRPHVSFRDRPAVVEEVPGEVSDRSILQIYLNEMGRTKLLTPKEERDMARRIKKGDRKARRHMIEANLRLVVKIARDYEGFGLPLLDLINEGNIGLMKGVERFRLGKGAKLSTYAALWIKQRIRLALDEQAHTIKVPPKMADRVRRVERVSAQLKEILGRDPTNSEISRKTGIKLRLIEEMAMFARQPIPLSSPINEGDGVLYEVIPDEQAINPSDDAERKSTEEMIGRILSMLDPREERILRLRFGFDSGDEKTLEEVGKSFRLTRERIRQIQNVAFRKVRTKLLLAELAKTI